MSDLNAWPDLRRRYCLMLLVGVAACSFNDARDAQRARPGSVDLEFAGCATVRSGPRCVLSQQRTVRVFAPSSEPWLAKVEPGHAALSLRSEPKQGGVLIQVVVPSGATLLTFETSSGARKFQLPLLEPEPTTALEEAKQLRGLGQFEPARERVAAALPSLSADLAGRARALLARLLLSEGDVAGAVAGLRASLEEAYQHGRISDAAEDATALAYTLCMNLREYAAARAVLERAALSCQQDPSARAIIPYYQALLERETGNLSKALELFQGAIDRSERIQLDEHYWFAREEYAATLAYLGRHAEAVTEQERIVAGFRSADACKLADRQETMAWYALLAEPAPESALAAKAVSASELAARTLTRCASVWRQRNHRINAALLALQRADAATADSQLRDLPALEPADPVLDTWEHEARGRIALQKGRARDALQEFEAAHALALRAALWENQHLALLGAARALAVLGRAEQALARYRQAEALLFDALGFVPLSAGQAGFQRAREAGTQELVSQALRMGLVDLALDCARAARNRSLSALSRDAVLAQQSAALGPEWQRALTRYRTERDALELAQAEAWRVPADRLAAHEAQIEQRRRAAHAALDAAYAVLPRVPWPRTAALTVEPGDVVLAYFPRPDGVLAFLMRSGETLSSELPALDPSQSPSLRVAALMRPFRSALAAVSPARVRIMTSASLADLDFHAYELDGEPLGAKAAVSYELDLGAETSHDQAPDQASVLIVGNPSGDLIGAELEAQEIASHFRGATLLLRGNATRARVRDALSGVGRLHFAGHARYAGLEGIDSALSLSDGELSLGEVLTLPRVPARVVLSACQSALSAGAGYASGLGIAQAFVAAGTREVVATTRVVDDDQARSFFARLYDALAATPQPSTSQALQQVIVQARASQPTLDWAAFRVLTP